MESAYRIHDPERPDAGPRVSVSIWAYQEAGSEQDEMRSWHFVCERCGCRMFPSFPREKKSGRRASPRPYFRAGKSDPHRANCGSPASIHDAATGILGDAEVRSKRGRAPAVFVDVERSEETRRAAAVTTAKQPQDDESRRSRRRNGSGSGTSISRTTSVRSLAVCWHRDRIGVINQPLAVPGCPGSTYGAVFQRVDAEFGLRLHAADDRFVFWSETAAARHATDGDGYFIRFPSKTKKNKWLMGVVPEAVLAESQSDELRSRIEAMTAGRGTTVYLLGGFRYDPGMDCFVLRSGSTRHVWVEPGSPD